MNPEDLGTDPIVAFERWYSRALESGGAQEARPDAMALATATASGAPSIRMVLLKSVDERGFVFYTNYESRKGQELADNPRAALALYWPWLNRQVRVEGYVARCSKEESAVYFGTRPRESRAAAWASRQSRVVASRRALDEAYEAVIRDSAGGPIRLPPFWGGYRLTPDAVEFWQGHQFRLHDRVRFSRSVAGGGWRVDRLAP